MQSASDSKLLEILVRPATADDVSFITNSWLQSVRSEFRMKKTEFFATHVPTINAILGRATTIVAADPEAPSVIYGWLCYSEPSVIHYVYVKQVFRREQIATRLLAAANLKAPLSSSYTRRVVKPWADRLGVKHDPYKAFI